MVTQCICIVGVGSFNVSLQVVFPLGFVGAFLAHVSEAVTAVCAPDMAF